MRLLFQIHGVQLPRLVEDPVHVVFTHHLVEMHRQLVVIHAISHDVVSVLQQDRKAEEHEERVPATEGGRRRQPTDTVRGLRRTITTRGRDRHVLLYGRLQHFVLLLEVVYSGSDTVQVRLLSVQERFAISLRVLQLLRHTREELLRSRRVPAILSIVNSSGVFDGRFPRFFFR